jgi:hypothetical protein
VQEVADVVDTVTLQGAEIIGIAKFGTQRLENAPVLPGTLWPDLAMQVLAQIVDHAIVVEERIVDIEQENELVRRRFPRAGRFHGDSSDRRQNSVVAGPAQGVRKGS